MNQNVNKINIKKCGIELKLFHIQIIKITKSFRIINQVLIFYMKNVKK